jgi:large subunit ribosomal protein L54
LFAKENPPKLTPILSPTAKSKKQRQRAAKALRKRALLNPESLAPKVPLYEQSVDLPGGAGSLEAAKEAGQARSGLTKAMRDKRRKMIKEDNFLRAMG